MPLWTALIHVGALSNQKMLASVSWGQELTLCILFCLRWRSLQMLQASMRPSRLHQMSVGCSDWMCAWISLLLSRWIAAWV